jgi:predicted transcriptional regulator
MMDIKAEKLELIQWLAGVRDMEVIKEFINLKKSKEVDWWDTISAEERAEIAEGIAQAEKGEVIPHEEVMAKYQKWL